jgi:hypothetical protein
VGIWIYAKVGSEAITFCVDWELVMTIWELVMTICLLKESKRGRIFGFGGPIQMPKPHQNFGKSETSV